MDKTPCLFIAIATSAELNDKTSWVNTSFQWNQKLQDTICQRLGEAIAAWSTIESHLMRLYTTAMKPRDLRAANWAWDAIHSPGALIDMTDGALRGMEKIALNIDTWEKLYKRLGRKVTRRNRIAHCQIFYEHTAESDSKKMFVASPNQAQGISKRFYATDLNDLREAFQSLATDLNAFYDTTFK